MVTGTVAVHTNGVKLTDAKSKEVLEYETLLSLRGEIYANTHPRLNVPVQPPKQGMNHASGLSKPSPRLQNGDHKLPSSAMPNGVHKPRKDTHPTPPQSKSVHAPVSQPVASTYKAPNTQLPASSRPASGSSGLDPIFLTKSEVLVKAELHQKRQRIERALDELNQNRVMARQRLFEQAALPSFDVTKVLQDAQQIVKPINPVENNATNPTPSPSDSFDEKDFYSSQMNDSTTDEVDDSGTKWRSSRACRYFVDGECRHGDACTFSHDPALKQRVETDGPQAMEIDSVNADEQAPSRPNNVLPSASTNEQSKSAATLQLDRIARLNHIEKLEEQLRNLKSQDSAMPHDQLGDSGSAPDEPAYSPPDAGDLVGVRQVGREKAGEAGKSKLRDTGESRAPALLEKKSREYVVRRDRIPHSPLSSDVRVVRNHITSPVAPQPARVSPLAVARVSQLHQEQRVFSDSNGTSQGSGGEAVSARQSPRIPLGKRRREIDFHDRARNVMPRRDRDSPEIRIKEEPVSPPPFAEPSEVWPPRQRKGVSKPVYVDTESPRFRDQEPVMYQPKSTEQVSHSYLADERRPTTPIARRVLSRNGHHLGAHEEQDLRRVLSARQIRVPRSPLEQYAPPQSSSARAVSQVYYPQPDPAVSLQPRASVQPQQIISHIDRDQSLSPVARARFSPTIRGPLTMAPPARRIVIDQYGQRYEAPLPAERQTSTVPVVRPSEFVPRYEQLVPRSPSFREPQVVNVYDERRYVRRAPSPQYVEYHPAPTSRHIVGRENEPMYGDEVYLPRNDGIRAVEYSEPRSAGLYEEVVRPREGLIRTQSVRPAVGGLYDEPREQITRIQSVRPDQDRVISLERRREVVPQVSRQVSVRADDTFSRPVTYTGAERPRYRHMTETQERRYVDEIPDEVVYEAPRSAGRRAVHRL
ncbi:hypothetical protein MMC07_003412 [Pseudocyphellaria aurata]|nr:hypothetical protein [Pseudocyphellaria aurata]